MNVRDYFNCLATVTGSHLRDRRLPAACATFARAMVVACAVAVLCSVPAKAQLQELFRTTDGSFANHVEYHRVDLPPGK
jgi:hypothetical protein